MRFSHVFFAVFLIMSCNDSDKKEVVTAFKKAAESAKKDEKKQEVTECSTLDNFKKECLVGNWKIQSVKIGEKDNMLARYFIERENYHLFIATDNKIKGNIFSILFSNHDDIKSSTISMPIEIPQTTYSFEEGSKKITFNGPSGSSIDLTVKDLKGKELTLEIKGDIANIDSKRYVLETVWSKE